MRSPLITVENKNNAGFAFRIKGKAFQEGYLFNKFFFSFHNISKIFAELRKRRFVLCTHFSRPGVTPGLQRQLLPFCPPSV